MTDALTIKEAAENAARFLPNIQENKMINNNIIFLDIETQHIIQEFEGGWNKKENYEKLKVAVAGIKCNGEIQLFEEHQTNELFDYLTNNKCKIVGHNLINFDYPVLRPYDELVKITSLITKTFDTWQELYKITGHMIGLDDLAKSNNIGIKKTEDSILIPQMWRDGKHKEVKDYLTNDLNMTEAIYNHGKNTGRFNYYQGTRFVNVKW